MAWCGNNHLLLNMTNTKEMAVDFRRTVTMLNSISILGDQVKVAEGYRYLGIHLDSRLDWKCDTEAVYRKGQSRLYFLRKFRPFIVCSQPSLTSKCIINTLGHSAKCISVTIMALKL